MTNSSDSTKTMLGLKASSRSKSLDEQKQKSLERDCLVLMSAFLSQNGYHQTASQLQNEANSVLGRWTCADNIDLRQVVCEFEEYFNLKNGRKPKFTRRKGGEKTATNANALSRFNDQSAKARPTTSPVFRRKKGRDARKEHRISNRNSKNLLPARLDAPTHLIKGNSFNNRLTIDAQVCEKEGEDEHERQQEQRNEERMLKPHPSFDDFDLGTLASSLQSDILVASPNIKWADIVGLEDAKRLLKEAIVLPLEFPSLFCGLLQPWRGILLFGLPGTGKTLLAKAAATESKTTFFNISASSIVSKFRGDSEKLIKVLFNLARHHAPSTIFFDEIDAILSHRGSSHSSGGEGIEHEGSRRMKSQFLVEMDGIGKGSEKVFILAATNLPWDLDSALLRRLDKRIHVRTPDQDARKKMIKKHFESHMNNLKEEEFEMCAASTKNFSGADIKLICKETAMNPIRKILQRLEKSSCLNKAQPVPSRQNLNIQSLLEQNPICLDDFKKSLASTSSSIGENDLKKYEQWEHSFGSV